MAVVIYMQKPVRRCQMKQSNAEMLKLSLKGRSGYLGTVKFILSAMALSFKKLIPKLNLK